MSWMPEHRSLLEEGLASLGLQAGGEALERLERFAREILLWNPAYGLLGVAPGESPEETAVRHILDSLAPLSLIRQEAPASLGDVGSGAGFPGVPLAVMLEDTEVTLIEKMGRRCDFLRNAVAVLGMKERIRILQQPLEKVTETFDGVTLRAFSPLPRVLADLLRITRPGGAVYAYKGRGEVIREELRQERGWEIRPLAVPFLEGERHLVFFRKPPEA